MKLGWLSDIHLNFLDEDQMFIFLDELASCSVDSWLLSGDIGEADSVIQYLQRIESAVLLPIYFVLGNHDYYGGSFAEVREQIRLLNSQSKNLVWLTEIDVQSLSKDVALIGDDTWADARLGDPHGSPVELNDFYLIQELSGLSRSERIQELNRLGGEASNRLKHKLLQAASDHRRVVILTHVPPFRESAWYRGKISSDDYLPWFSCKSIGEVIFACASSHPKCEFLVLCGHTHGSGSYSPISNVTVRTAAAEYGYPEVQDTLEF